MESLEAIIEKLKGEIITQLNLVDFKKEDIDADTALFGAGLGLDSIDAIELTVLLDRNYGVKISSPLEGKKVFVSIRTMAEYILANQK